jgi:chaperonin cofactor prefoldin
MAFAVAPDAPNADVSKKLDKLMKKIDALEKRLAELQEQLEKANGGR